MTLHECDVDRWIGRRLDDVHTEALLHRFDVRIVQINQFNYCRNAGTSQKRACIDLVVTIDAAALIAWNAASALMFSTSNPARCKVIGIRAARILQ
jgi:hypothetical protein